MAMVRPDDEGASIQADLTRQNIGIVAIRESTPLTTVPRPNTFAG